MATQWNCNCSLLLFVFLLLVVLCSAGIENVNIKTLKPRDYTGDRFAFFTRAKAPQYARHNSNPYFSLNLTISKKDGLMLGSAQYIRFHWKYQNDINFRRRDRNQCLYYDPGFNPVESQRFKVVTFNFTESLTFAINEYFEVTEDDGPYYWLLVNCLFGDKSTDNSLALRGRTEFKNPTGWLSGDDFYWMPFLIFWFILWFVSATLWTVWLIIFRKETHIIQRGIGALYWICAIDCMIWMIVYVRYNKTGKSPVFAMMVAALTTAVRNTAARLLLLVVCMGYRVISRELGTKVTRMFVYIITPVYFLLTLIWNWMDTLDSQTRSNVPGGVLGVFLGLIFICDVLWYVAIVYTLIWTVRILKDPRYNIHKRFTYTVFLWAMIICGIVAIIISIVGVVSSFGTLFDRWWRAVWFFDAFWEILFFVLMSVLSFMWRPSLADNFAFEDVPAAPAASSASAASSSGVPSTSYADKYGAPTSVEMKTYSEPTTSEHLPPPRNANPDA